MIYHLYIKLPHITYHTILLCITSIHTCMVLLETKILKVVTVPALKYIETWSFLIYQCFLSFYAMFDLFYGVTGYFYVKLKHYNKFDNVSITNSANFLYHLIKFTWHIKVCSFYSFFFTIKNNKNNTASCISHSYFACQYLNVIY